MTTPQDNIRKAAVLVASLDAATAQSLLAQFPAGEAEKIRRAVDRLGDVTPEERHAVLAELQQRGEAPRRAAHEGEDEGVELALSAAATDDATAQDSTTSTPSTESAESADRPFSFLHSTRHDELSPLLAGEHPQTVALILAHLPSKQAAGIISTFDAKFRTRVLERLIHIGDPDPDALEEVERNLKLQFGSLQAARGDRRQGIAAAKAILEIASAEACAEMIAGLSEANPLLARALDFPAVARRQPEVATAQPVPTIAAARPPAPRVEFDQLMHLSTRQLGRALRRVDSELLCLAAMGAEPHVLGHLLAALPDEQAEALRNRLENPGPIRLTDVEEAQQEVARLVAEPAREEAMPDEDTEHLVAVA